MPPDTRATAAQRGYDARWGQTRKRYLRDHPTCEHPACDEPAVDVHHLDGLGPKGPRGHDPTNLQALCHPHHSIITNAAMPKRRRPAEQHPGLLG